MAEFKTHYDNLQVSRNASDAVIKAAYKSLAQQYHPDRYNGSLSEAERIIKLLNEAYSVLSDPDKRQKHDEWIAEEERADASGKRNRNNDEAQGQRSAPTPPEPSSPPPRNTPKNPNRYYPLAWWLIVSLVVTGFMRVNTHGDRWSNWFYWITWGGYWGEAMATALGIGVGGAALFAVSLAFRTCRDNKSVTMSVMVAGVAGVLITGSSVMSDYRSPQPAQPYQVSESTSQLPQNTRTPMQAVPANMEMAERVNSVIARIEQASYELREGSSRFNQKGVDDILSNQNKFISEGMDPDKALEKAYQTYLLERRSQLIMNRAKTESPELSDTSILFDQEALRKFLAYKDKFLAKGAAPDAALEKAYQSYLRAKPKENITNRADKIIPTLKSPQRKRDMSDIEAEDRESIESACSTDKYVNGPAAYHRCVNRHLSSLARK